MALIRGVTKEGKEVWYTGKAGASFVSNNKADAFIGYDKEGAQRKAKQFNEMTAIHGIHFIAIEA